MSHSVTFRSGPGGFHVERRSGAPFRPASPSEDGDVDLTRTAEDDDADLQAALEASLAHHAAQTAPSSAPAVPEQHADAHARAGSAMSEQDEVRALIVESLAGLSREEILDQAIREGVSVAGMTRSEMQDAIVAHIMGEVAVPQGHEGTDQWLAASAPPAAAAQGGGSSSPQAPPAERVSDADSTDGFSGIPFMELYPPSRQSEPQDYVLRFLLPGGGTATLSFPADALVGQLYSSIWELQQEAFGAPGSRKEPPFILSDDAQQHEFLDMTMLLRETHLPSSGSRLVVAPR